MKKLKAYILRTLHVYSHVFQDPICNHFGYELVDEYELKILGFKLMVWKKVREIGCTCSKIFYKK